MAEQNIYDNAEIFNYKGAKIVNSMTISLPLTREPKGERGYYAVG